jgi:hypothetical protein
VKKTGKRGATSEFSEPSRAFQAEKEPLRGCRRIVVEWPDEADRRGRSSRPTVEDLIPRPHHGNVA